MARTATPVTAGVGSYPVLPLAANAADLTMTAADVANLNMASYGSAARLMLLAQNTHATNPANWTITSAPDSINRVGDITNFVLQAGDIAFFIAERAGWRQSDNNLYFSGDAATVKFGVIKL